MLEVSRNKVREV